MTEPRDQLHDIHGRLFQARMWRRYAQAWDRENRPRIVGREWMEFVGFHSREACMRRARVNLYLARRLNRRKRPLPQ